MRPWFALKIALLLALSVLAQAAGGLGSPRGKDPFLAGFNQGWLVNRFGTQWNSEFDLNGFKRAIEYTSQAEGKILRLWLFESHASDALIWEDGRPVGLHPRFVRNLRAVIAEAGKAGIQLSLTLFDGNMNATPPRDPSVAEFWSEFLNDSGSTRSEFIYRVYLPLLRVLGEPASRGVVTQLDLVNELNAWVEPTRSPRIVSGWRGASRFVCEFHHMLKASGLAPELRMTASIGWDGAAATILRGFPPTECVDFFDIHEYGDAGEIASCRELVAYARERGKGIQLGEFGQKEPVRSDALQELVTRNFIHNARSCGFDAAMAWRLMEGGSRYHGYEIDGVLRPGYRAFREAACGCVR